MKDGSTAIDVHTKPTASLVLRIYSNPYNLTGFTACAVCGKSLSKEKSKNGAPAVQGQRFSAK